MQIFANPFRERNLLSTADWDLIFGDFPEIIFWCARLIGQLRSPDPDVGKIFLDSIAMAGPLVKHALTCRRAWLRLEEISQKDKNPTLNNFLSQVRQILSPRVSFHLSILSLR